MLHVKRLSPGRPSAASTGLRISRAPIKKMKLRIVSARHPGHPSTVRDRVAALRPRFRSRLSRLRLRIPAPLNRARFRIPRLQESRNVGHISRDAHHHVIANHQRRHRREVSQRDVGQLHLPSLLAVLRVQADKKSIRRFEIEPVAPHADAAIADVIAAVRLVGVVPDLAAGSRIHRPHIIGHAEIEHAVHLERRRFHSHRVRNETPRQARGFQR